MGRGEGGREWCGGGGGVVQQLHLTSGLFCRQPSDWFVKFKSLHSQQNQIHHYSISHS